MSQQIAVITGASRGIGRAVALSLAAQNYHVALLARNEQALNALADEIIKAGNSASVHIVDMTHQQDVAEIIAAIAKTYQRIDVFVNNAGIVKAGTSQLSPAEFTELVNTNLLGAFYGLHAVVAVMQQQQKGYIFNLASRAGKVGLPFLGGYSASKFGLVGLSESLYKELVHSHIKVTAICPGLINTDMAKGFKGDPESLIQVSDIVKTIDYLLGLGSTVCVSEVMLECAMHVIEENPMKAI